MTVDFDPAVDEHLRAALAGLLNLTIEDIPDEVGVSWIARAFGVTTNTVLHAVKVGKLPADAIPDLSGSVLTYRVRPADALLVWGHRLRTKEKPMPEYSLARLFAASTTPERRAAAVAAVLAGEPIPDPEDEDTTDND